MKVLHTGDLHLGRVFHERLLIEDQHHMLETILEILTRDRYEALLVAGDVYDRSIPAAEAVSLLGSFFVRLREVSPQTKLCLIAGNHDSAQRLGYGKELFRAMGIHIATTFLDSLEPVVIEGPHQERAAIFLLPFLYPDAEYMLQSLATSHSERFLPEERKKSEEGEKNSNVKEVFQDEKTATGIVPHQEGLIRRAAQILEQQRERWCFHGIHHTILVGHLFARGGQGSNSERILVGNAEVVDPALFAGFDYLALGHLHRYQQVAANAWYSGSPLAYSFDEVDQQKVILSVELQPGRPPLVTPIPLHPLRPLRRLSGPFSSFLSGNAIEKEEGALRSSYLEIELSDETLVENPLSILRQRFPYLLSVKQDRALAQLSAHQVEQRRSQGHGEGKNLVEDFSLFLSELYQQTDPARLDFFTGLLLEMEQSEQDGGSR
ncbi:MAG: exonuclease SbcCD subunit D [Treponemataceae bacterium]|nr:exonuclease SbcCD subunit D [Treponemataceae bacterium]